MLTELKIDPEFQNKIPPLTEQEYQQLEENILADGEVYEPICVWNGTIVDGHNRWKIIQAHQEIPYQIKEMPFTDKWEAFDWMYKKQLGRRNLTDENKSYLLGKLYEARKKIVGAPKGNTNAKKNNVSAVDTLKLKAHDRVSESIAKELGIGNGTVIRASQFARGIDAIKEISEEASDKILTGRTKVTKKSVQEFKKLDEPQKTEFIDSVLSGEKPKQKPQGFTKEARRDKKLLDEVVSDMYSPEKKEFTVEMLLGDIEINGEDYVNLLRNTLIERSTLLIGENRSRVVEKIDEIINKIQKLKELIK